MISDRCNLVTGVHKEIAMRLKEIRDKDDVWLSGQDMAQAFKPMKMGLRACHLIEDWNVFEDKYNRIRKTCQQLFKIDFDQSEAMKDLEHFKQLRDIMLKNQLVDDTVMMINQEIKNGKRILVEDASSCSMDIDTGLYPYTDSFHTTTGAVCTGLGVPEEAIETTIGVFSAISIISKDFLTRIEDFPTQIQSSDPAYESIQRRLQTEYKIEPEKYAFGWTDLNMIRHAELINKLSSLMLTHLDVLSEVETIKLASKYSLKEDGEEIIFEKALPALIDDWESMEPQYKTLPGWNSDICDCQTFEDLPTEAKSFVRNIEQISKKEVQYVSVNDESNEGLLRIIR